MSTSINNINAIGNNLILDVIGTVGMTSFVSTFIEAYRRGTGGRIFTLRQWKVLKEIFRDNEGSWDAILNELNLPYIYFPESKNGDEDYNIFTVYRNHIYDHWSHGFERLVVKEN